MSGKILVVDDIETNVILLVNILEKEYYDVITAEDGEEAILKAHSEMPDLILLDVMMPGIDGFEVCKRLKNDPKTMWIPIIMVTALSEKEDRIAGIAISKADDFITKPFDKKQLSIRVKSLLSLKEIINQLQLRISVDAKLGGILNNEVIENVNNIKSAKILLIDDDPIESEKSEILINDFNKKMNFNFQLDMFEDYDNAFEAIKENKDYDVILISSLLQNIDSLKVCAKIRNIKGILFSRILIIIEPDDMDTAMKAISDLGVADYVTMPIQDNKDETLARILQQLRYKKYHDILNNCIKNNIHMATHDKLTGCYNRQYLDIYTEDLFKEKGSVFSLIILDIDYFKKVNDELGHSAGDAILSQLPKVLTDAVGAKNLLVRYGGEEFIIILPEQNMDNALILAEKARNLVEGYSFILPDNATLNKTMSLGVSERNDSDSLSSLIERADAALYEAKEGGRNRVISK